MVIAETMKLIQDDAVIDAIVAEVMELQDQENTTLPLLEKQMREVENGIENMLNAIQAGVLTNSTKSRLEKLEAQQKELEVRIAEEKIARPRLSENQVRFWLTRFRKLDPNVKSHRETLINAFVNAVYLYDEKVLITFNYKDGTKTITFDEIHPCRQRCPRIISVLCTVALADCENGVFSNFIGLRKADLPFSHLLDSVALKT